MLLYQQAKRSYQLLPRPAQGDEKGGDAGKCATHSQSTLNRLLMHDGQREAWGSCGVGDGRFGCWLADLSAVRILDGVVDLLVVLLHTKAHAPISAALKSTARDPKRFKTEKMGSTRARSSVLTVQACPGLSTGELLRDSILKRRPRSRVFYGPECIGRP